MGRLYDALGATHKGGVSTKSSGGCAHNTTNIVMVFSHCTENSRV